MKLAAGGAQGPALLYFGVWNSNDNKNQTIQPSAGKCDSLSCATAKATAARGREGVGRGSADRANRLNPSLQQHGQPHPSLGRESARISPSLLVWLKSDVTPSTHPHHHKIVHVLNYGVHCYGAVKWSIL